MESDRPLKGADRIAAYVKTLPDAPGVYRKMRLMSFAESTVPAGFDGTYCMVTGFFSSAQDEWKPIAQKRANELKALSARLKEP